MAYEMKENTGSLFKNDRKEKDTHADYRGSALLSGVEHWMDAWINETSSGVKYMSVKFKPKDANGAGTSSARQQPASAFDDSDIPF